jgi:DNA-directed RNA polymerase subunit L
MPNTVKKSKNPSNKSDIIQNELKVRIIDHKPIDNTFNNYLILGFKGQDINNVIMNTLRRVIMELVPTYGYDKKDINIIKNTSIYNNDYMRLRLSHFPVIGINNDFETINRSSDLEYEANISTFEKKIDDLDEIEKRKNAEKLEKSQNLTMSLNINNTTNTVLCVTTNDKFAKFYYKGIPIQSPYKDDLLIIKLKPGEEFNCTTISTLNIGLKGANFMPNAVCIFTEPEDKDGEYSLNIESIKQMTEQDIIIRACSIINLKLVNFLDVFTTKITEYKSEYISDDYNLENKEKNIRNSDSESDSDIDTDKITYSAIINSTDDVLEQHRIKGIIKIENESHTFGNLLSRILQDHKLIEFAGYKIDHLLIKELTIGYKTTGEDIINILNEIISKAISVFSSIKNSIELLKFK